MKFKYMRVKLIDIVPQQHYLSRDKLEKVSEFLSANNDYGKIYVIEYKNCIFSVDGHHRLFWLYLNNIREVDVVCELSDNDSLLYRKLADESLNMNIRTIADLENCILENHKDYERLWIDKCQLLLLSNKDVEIYKNNPCKFSALPLYKELRIDKRGFEVIHDESIHTSKNISGQRHDKFFRLKHDLNNIYSFEVEGFCIAAVDFTSDKSVIRELINLSYIDISISDEEIEFMIRDRVFFGKLWIYIVEENTERKVALGICHFDRIVNEVVFDWIQVLPDFRGKGIGKMLISYLLLHTPKEAEFATVSGDIENHNSPEMVYRSCGFEGNDIWHIIRKK